MADTLKFGPEWLRALSDGNTVASPPPTPSLGKFKLAEYRYGREEMLALFHEKYDTPPDLLACPSVCTEETQKPLALIALSEEEQRLMSQSVNSMTVLRGMGRGGPPMRGRGISDRGRGRGRGRGEGFLSRGVSLENGEMGGFGRPTQRTNKDGWEEVGKKLDRGFPLRSQEEGIPPVRREYVRSQSTENWREKDEDDDGDWRRVGVKDRWGAKGNWRDPNFRAGFEQDRKTNGQYKERMRNDPDEKSMHPRTSRSTESWDTDDVPEWSVTGDDDMDELGTFDASGQFVTTDVKDGDKEKNDREEKPVLQPEKKTINISKKMEKFVSKEKSSKDGGTPANEDQEKSPTEHRKESAKKPKSVHENGSSDTSHKPNGSPETKQTDRKKVKSEKQTVPDQKKLSAESSKPESVAASKKSVVDRSTSKATAKENRSLMGRSEGKAALPVEREVLDRLEKEAESLVANVTSEESGNEDSPVKKEETAPASRELVIQWFYRDPQGDTQGPFTPEEMAQWFSAGYFTMNLLVKRGCDERFQQLGELIKRWGRVPFLGGPSPPPLLNNPVSTAASEAEVKTPSPQPVPVQPAPLQPGPPLSNQLELLQQQFLMQQLLQQQLVMRQMTMRLMSEMQDQESFKALPPSQQQQLATQMLMQTQPVLFQQLQQIQQQQQQQQATDRLSPQPSASDTTSDTSPPTFHRPTSPPSFHRSTSQPVTIANLQDTSNLSGSWSQPSSVWDVDQPKVSLSPTGVLSLMENQRTLQEEEAQRRKLEEFDRAQEEIRRQQADLERQREQVMREKEELERQKQIEMKRLEEELRKQIEQQERERLERDRQERERREKEATERILQAQIENRRREEEERQRREQEERQRREQEERQRREQEERQKREQEERQRREHEERQRRELEERQRQELEKRKRQEVERCALEAKRQMEEAEERERREAIVQQQEVQRQHEEMLRQQELQKQAAAEEEKQRQVDRQRQQMQELQQEQQRQQQEALYKLQQQQHEQLARMQLPASAKWAENDSRGKANSSQSLAEIQEQEEHERQETQRLQMELQHQQQQMIFQQQQQQQQQKSWANHMQAQSGDGLKTLLEIQAEQEMQLEHDRKKRKPHPQQPRQMIKTKAPEEAAVGTWNAATAQSGWGDKSIWSSEKSTGLGFWDDAIISTSKKAPTKNKEGEFPALANKKQGENQKASNRSKPKSSIKEKEVVQRLFQASRPSDDFTQWCEKALTNMASSVDVPTFIAFLQDVESPYEVHDYVKSYLGESKQTTDFARQFLEKRSHYKNKARLEKQQEEDSIWGPAPAVNPKEPRSTLTDVDKAKGKKKKRMQKIDQSILGFTVHASQSRVNAGEIDPAD